MSDEEQWMYFESPQCKRGGIGPISTTTMRVVVMDNPLATIRLLPGAWATLEALKRTYVWAAAECNPLFTQTFHWSYVDLAGHEVGPVAGDLMMLWEKAGHFPPETQVRYWATGDFPASRLPQMIEKKDKGKEEEEKGEEEPWCEVAPSLSPRGDICSSRP